MTGTARADDRAERQAHPERAEKKVRATATVEVLEDARHVDDIISRLKAAQRGDVRPERADPGHDPASQGTGVAAPLGEEHHIERPALPNAIPADVHGPHAGDHDRGQQQHRDHRTEREPHPPGPPSSKHATRRK
jgi:hypothetical protein